MPDTAAHIWDLEESGHREMGVCYHVLQSLQAYERYETAVVFLHVFIPYISLLCFLSLIVVTSDLSAEITTLFLPVSLSNCS